MSDSVSMMSNIQNLLSDKKKCDRCVLADDRTQVVLPELPAGDLTGRIVFIGQNPGQVEDREGAPFIAAAGKELDQWFELLGWKRSDCIIENAVACRTFHNCAPTIHEIGACQYWLNRELDIFKPKLLVLLGGTAGLALNVNSKHGHVLKTAHGVAYTLLHPSFVLQKPRARATTHEDLKKLKKVLGNQDKVAKLQQQFREQQCDR